MLKILGVFSIFILLLLGYFLITSRNRIKSEQQGIRLLTFAEVEFIVEKFAEYFAEKISYSTMKDEIDSETSLLGGDFQHEGIKELVRLAHLQNSENQSFRKQAEILMAEIRAKNLSSPLQ